MFEKFFSRFKKSQSAAPGTVTSTEAHPDMCVCESDASCGGACDAEGQAGECACGKKEDSCCGGGCGNCDDEKTNAAEQEESCCGGGCGDKK